MNKRMRCAVSIIALVLFVGLGMFLHASESKAASGYAIRINKQQNCVTIYKANKNGKYKPVKAMVCSVGAATPLGTFPLKEKIRWHVLEGPVYGQYCTRITGHILFHSVWYYKNNAPNTLSYTQYNKLGQVASHGCVRLCVGDARWIYNNVPSGTPVTIYKSKNPGPLGKPDGIKLKGYTGWDPTDDTNPSNPYNKKKPVIKLKKGDEGSTKISYATRVDPIKKITALNTTGFDSIKKVTYTVKYKTNKSATPKKVKKINTRKSGIYVVKYSLTDEINRKASLTVKYKVLGKVSLKEITLNRTSKVLFLGGSKDDASFKLSLSDFKPAAASITDLSFKSSDENVVSVDKNGNVTANGLGTATLRAKTKDGTKIKAYCTITVKKYASDINAVLSKTTFNVGETGKIAVSLVPADATGTKNLAYTYSSSNPAVVTVDGEGNVRAAGAGSAVISVSAAGAGKNGVIVKQITVNVTAPAGDVSPAAIGVNN